MNLKIVSHLLQFIKPAGTSRGILDNKKVYYIVSEVQNDCYALGEVGCIPGLSPDCTRDLMGECTKISKKINASFSSPVDALAQIDSLVVPELPSVRFGFETLLLDMLNGQKQKIFDNRFYSGNQQIRINGLIWMGNHVFMLQQIREKVKAGFGCVKMKVGAIDFEEELQLIRYIREEFSERDLIIRVDANGAWSAQEALERMERLSKYNIHSIEQPVKAGQMTEMKKVIEAAVLPVALDEELIGISGIDNKEKLLTLLNPPFIILKPGLLGGFGPTDEWIELARRMGIDWWITSALESNVGLNAICQYTAGKDIGDTYQGLGTGQLFQNNIQSPLIIKGELLRYDCTQQWDFSFF